MLLCCILMFKYTDAVRLLSSVDAQVALQCLQVAETCPAGVTWVRLFPGVDQNMSTQVSDLQHTYMQFF